MKTIWVSLRRLKAHELHQTLRHIANAGASWADIYLRLGEVQNESVKRTLKLAPALTIAYILLEAFTIDGLTSVKAFDYSLQVPSTYIATYSSIILFLFFQHLMSVFVVIGVRAKQSARSRIPRFSANMFGYYNHQDEMALSVPSVLNYFLVARLPVSRFLELLILAIYSTLLLSVLALWGFLFKYQFLSMISSEIGIVSQGIAAIGMFSLTAIAIVALPFNLPVPYRRNSHMIRWLFLSRLYPIGAHPKVEDWLGKECER